MTTIEWAHAGLGRGETWNPIRANNDPMGDPTRVGWHCEKVSPACEHCYAERQNMAGARGGTKYPYKPGHRANGNIHVYLDEKTLLAPLSWKQPTGIFVCSMTDAFGDWAEDAWLDKMFAVAALCPQHIFIFLTKRPARMREYLTELETPARIASDGLHEATMGFSTRKALVFNATWPLPNVWLGVTAEDQRRADERIPDLLATPAAVRFVSCEPLLGPIDLTAINFWSPCNIPEYGGDGHELLPALRPALRKGRGPGIDLIIAGGESGPGARPSHPDWFRGLRDQCAAAGVPFFFKQWGEFEPNDSDHPIHGRATTPTSGLYDCAKFPGGQKMNRVGKRRAGRQLDGREHNEFPRAQS